MGLRTQVVLRAALVLERHAKTAFAGSIASSPGVHDRVTQVGWERADPAAGKQCVPIEVVVRRQSITLDIQSSETRKDEKKVYA